MLKARVQSKELGGAEYRVRPLPTTKSLVVLSRALKMAAPAFGDVASLREAAQAFMMLLSGVAAHLDEDVLVFVCHEFAAVTRVAEGDKVIDLKDHFELHFEGRLDVLFDWLRFAAEVTYGPLLARLTKAMDEPGSEPAAPEA